MDVTQAAVVYSEEQLKEVFNQSFIHVYSNLSSTDGKEIAVIEFLTDLVSNFNLYSRFTPDEITGLTSVVFQSDIVRDFVLSFQAVFLGRWIQGRGPGVVSSLAQDLARSISTDAELLSQYRVKVEPNFDVEKDYCFMPAAVKGNLAPYKEVVRLLHANPWLICILLFQQYLNIEILDKITDRTKTKK